MDRLKEIRREGGYPWVAEEIEIIEKHADYINALLDGLRMPAKSCVFVQKNTNQSGKLAESIVYVVASDNGKGELFVLKADDDIMVADLLSGTAAKLHVEIVPTDVGVTGAQDVTWLACYTTNRVTLTDDAEDYTFYDLNDLLRPARWTDLRSHLGAIVRVPRSSTTETDMMYLADDYPQLFRRSGHEIEVDLKYRIIGYGNVVGTVYPCMLQCFTELASLGIGDDVEVPLNCAYQSSSTVSDTSTYRMLQCCIADEGIYIRGLNETSGYVRVWGRVSLK